MYCTNNWSMLIGGGTDYTTPNDICVSPAWRWTQGMAIQSISDDLNGATQRVISNSFGKYDSQAAYWNGGLTPSGAWAFTKVSASFDGTIKLFKVPPPVRDAVNRTGYVPTTVTLPAAAGADGAVVEFGYGEQGEGRFYCTARQEACVANAGAMNPANPFYFGGEAYAPAPCASGCAIVLPGISGRVIEYRLKRFSGGTLTYTSPMMFAAVR